MNYIENVQLACQSLIPNFNIFLEIQFPNALQGYYVRDACGRGARARRHDDPYASQGT
jgi:hypothetical protein